MYKHSNSIWHHHEEYRVIVLNENSFYIIKDADVINQLEIEDCPDEIQEFLVLEVNRLISNFLANKISK